jgi:2,5-diketo-D-gluconate reductase A
MITLNDRNKIPQLGFGVFQIEPENTVEAVLQALEVGYRHIDTAEMYQNEKQVGEAIKQSGIDRSEIFITSKLHNSLHKTDDAKQAIKDTLERIETDYVDLFLIHWPLPSLYDGDYVATWKLLEEFKANGQAKSIGVSNFQIEHLKKLDSAGTTTPAVNQIELHPYLLNSEVADYDRSHDIATEAWSPIAQGDVLDNEVIEAIAKDVSKSSAQVVLRWHIQRGNIVFPKSVTADRVKENFEIFDFTLGEDQMKAIDGLDKGESGRTGPNPDKFDYTPKVN